MTPYDFKDPDVRRRRFRPIPVRMLVPNVITLLAICAGLTSIRLSIEGRMTLAVYAIVFAAALDGIDGRVARMIKGQSKFGAELDSLADFVNFGVAPGLMLYFWQLHELGNAGWIAAMVFAISGGLRLARFNATMDDPNKPAFAANFFTGVPAPAGAITVLLPIYRRVPRSRPAARGGDGGLYAADRLPDGVAPAGVLRQDQAHARAARTGAAGVRRGDRLHRDPDRLSLAHAVDRHGAVSARLPLGYKSYRDQARAMAATAPPAARSRRRLRRRRWPICRSRRATTTGPAGCTERQGADFQSTERVLDICHEAALELG